MSEPMVRRVLVAVSLAALLGGGSAPAPAPALAAATCGGSSHRLKTVSLPKAGFRIGVPRAWQTITGQSYGRVLDDAAGKDPQIAAFAAALKDPRSPLKLFALACEGRAYPSTLSVMAFDLKRDPHWSFADFERGTLKALRDGAVRGHAPKIERFHVRIGSAVRIRALERPRGATSPLSMTAYLVKGRQNAYMISYSTVPGLAGRYAHLFEDSVRSLREL
jgi:hypothetical protein